MRSGDASPVTTSAGRPGVPKAFPQTARRPTRPPRRVAGRRRWRSGAGSRCGASRPAPAPRRPPRRHGSPSVRRGGASRRARRHRPSSRQIRRPARARSRAASSPARPAPRWRAGRAGSAYPPGHGRMSSASPSGASGRRTIASRGRARRRHSRRAGCPARTRRRRRDCNEGSMPTPVSRTSMRQPGARLRAAARQQHAAGGCVLHGVGEQVAHDALDQEGDRPAHAARRRARRDAAAGTALPSASGAELVARRCISASRSKGSGRGTTAPASMRDTSSSASNIAQRAQQVPCASVSRMASGTAAGRYRRR